MYNTWTLDDGRKINLLTPTELKNLPDGTVVIDIFGEESTKGVDYLDGETRGGYTAFGLLQNDVVETIEVDI